MNKRIYTVHDYADHPPFFSCVKRTIRSDITQRAETDTLALFADSIHAGCFARWMQERLDRLRGEGENIPDPRPDVYGYPEWPGSDHQTQFEREQAERISRGQ